MAGKEPKAKENELDPWKIIKLSNARREFEHMSLADKVWTLLHSEEAHYAVIVLLILDVLVVVALITVHIEYMKSQIDEYHNVVQKCKVESPNASCSNQNFGKESLHDAESALFIISIVILFLFLADNVLQLIAKP